MNTTKKPVSPATTAEDQDREKPAKKGGKPLGGQTTAGKPVKKSKSATTVLSDDKFSDKIKKKSKGSGNQKSDIEPKEEKPATSAQKKRKATDTTESSDKTSTKKKKLNSGESTEVTNPSPLTWADLPERCPCIPCSDHLPRTAVPKILALFNQEKDLRDAAAANGIPAKGRHFLRAQICQMIVLEKRRPYLEKLGERQRWPNVIDWEDVSQRVFALQPTVIALFKNPQKLATCPAWESFLVSIDYNIFDFVDAKSKQNFPSAISGKRCGYYGPQGEFVIYSCLMRIVVEIDDDDEQELADTLFSTLHAIITSDNDHFLDYNDNASSQYLTVEDFTRFVLVPFIAVSLIREDLAAVETFQEGLFERNNSNEYGEFFFPESDSPEAHEIHRRNMKAIHSIQRDREPEPTAELTPETAPPRHHRAIVKTEPSSTSIKIILPPPKPVIEQEITVQDFTPPPQGKNSKKPVAPKKQLPSKKPKEPKKPSQVGALLQFQPSASSQGIGFGIRVGQNNNDPFKIKTSSGMTVFLPSKPLLLDSLAHSSF
ncbi:hypothetical protein B0H11DRAFT_1973713 [Mycena galericulata]|nr:hypothetical protein B0H11DRAFT_1973713 [Mycena galericulata]